MPTVTRDGVSLSDEADGPTDAEPVVFSEGLGYGRWMWRWQRRAPREGYWTGLSDNRGTGDAESPSGPYTIDELATDLESSTLVQPDWVTERLRELLDRNAIARP